MDSDKSAPTSPEAKNPGPSKSLRRSPADQEWARIQDLTDAGPTDEDAAKAAQMMARSPQHAASIRAALRGGTGPGLKKD